MEKKLLDFLNKVLWNNVKQNGEGKELDGEELDYDKERKLVLRSWVMKRKRKLMFINFIIIYGVFFKY